MFIRIDVYTKPDTFLCRVAILCVLSPCILTYFLMISPLFLRSELCFKQALYRRNVVWRKNNNQAAFRLLALVTWFFIVSWPVASNIAFSLSSMLLSITLIWLSLILFLYALTK
ncbi:hypothetical protein SVI_0651 [Shewanella violacea DSS12]|uniref:Uncharacterized protein n=1 Tax=Shewanella violacea (strain JCM 10179 / CIP 106290 / LMG 19151 / DSS12) TaxID=637905 RepID=D4ZG23_SHEVD|nr:hypothetical protein SVI_0651 [Shewanella violacea DSS12]